MATIALKRKNNAKGIMERTNTTQRANRTALMIHLLKKNRTAFLYEEVIHLFAKEKVGITRQEVSDIVVRLTGNVAGMTPKYQRNELLRRQVGVHPTNKKPIYEVWFNARGDMRARPTAWSTGHIDKGLKSAKFVATKKK
jgi:hypothetical protein